VTAHERAPSRTERGALQSLASHVSLALESAALTEEVLRRTTDARLSSLVQHASDLITVVDAGGIVIYQSPSVERVLGYRPEEVAGSRFDELLLDEKGLVLHLLTPGSAHENRDGEPI